MKSVFLIYLFYRRREAEAYSPVLCTVTPTGYAKGFMQQVQGWPTLPFSLISHFFLRKVIAKTLILQNLGLEKLDYYLEKKSASDIQPGG